MKSLNPTEKKLLALLKQNNGNSIWPIAIHNTIQTGCDKAFRNLLGQLKSEGEKVPNAMENIIGADAYNLLLAL